MAQAKSGGEPLAKSGSRQDIYAHALLYSALTRQVVAERRGAEKAYFPLEGFATCYRHS
jgi:hypothetical protein